MTFELHPNTQLGPVKLKVSNLERSVTFYKEIIGFKILNKTDQKAELTADGKETLLILEEVPSGSVYRPGTTLGLYHVAILLPERSDLGLFLKQMIEKRIEIGSADHFVSEAIYLSDPDFNGLEIYRDRPRKGWTKVSSGDYTMVTERIDVEGLLESAGEDVWQGLPPKTKIGHIHLHVRDLKESRDFYKALGFDITVGNMTNVGMLFLAAGGYHHHIGVNIWAGPNALVRPKNAVGLAYYTVMLPNQVELTKLIEHLKAVGEKPVEQQNGVWIVQDPVGIEIHLTTE
ncbi:VOC family protein [Halalkalibacter alkaliphilus]|uniref:VOC family protein n=1 Tax=Halalkalibacter alkaliphilus TaxID=2917993 RepID=A0A9X2I8N9_9BACI|nr:VOC family protein [Halalkalibacter alkaliphilus]MCL7749828.1 VOC family protein [Halalkalibacter alkaliphilus]